MNIFFFFLLTNHRPGVILHYNDRMICFILSVYPERTAKRRVNVMEKKKVFIDGKAGTTGISIYGRLQSRDDIELIVLPEEERKSDEARKKAINSCDVAILCLPDDAARQAVSFCENEDVVILDASTAHRTDDSWVYGMPEYSSAQKEKIAGAKRIAIPGCHASGFIALVAPLVRAGLLRKTEPLVCHSLTGYSGGGKKMIADYSAPDLPEKLKAPRIYALSQQHKHLPEMTKVTGLVTEPIFLPVVSDFYSGMLVTVPLFSSQIAPPFNKDCISRIYSETYDGKSNIYYCPDMEEDGFLDSNALSGNDKMQLGVFGNDERIILAARYDNLGKGAAGAAEQCLEIVLKRMKEKDATQ